MTDLVGKILKSKIDGKKFIVDGIHIEPAARIHKERKFYKIRLIGSEKIVMVETGNFEKGYLENLEIIAE